MSYTSLRACVQDLERTGQLLRIPFEVDPNLEMAAIHRRIFEQGGPAILFEKVKGSPFQAVSNLYGTFERTRFLFRHTLEKVQKVIELKADPSRLIQNPLRYLGTPFTALTGLPMKARFSKPILYGQTTIDQLPQVKSWPMDGGAFITLPQVFSLPPRERNIMKSNLGMYRIQLSGNDYLPNQEIGLHYQLHRGIGVHHTMYNETEEDFKVSIFVGGPPAHAFAAIMPLPEGLSELTFGGLLNGRRFRYFWKDGYVLSADADFCITGRVLKKVKKPEGPFGDHLGYYSLAHDFPVLQVDKVYHRKDAIWHFSVVGRPPAEDSSFGYLIHELVKELTASEFPGLHEVNAVDAAGVHPLLLAVGSERYMPFRERKPEEILTIANHLLGKGQTSLAKYLIIAAKEPGLHAHDIPAFFEHVLSRVDWTRDLHFQTKTTIDTLDYSGSGWNEGSKVVMACCGPVLRQLGREVPSGLNWPAAVRKVRLAQPGVLAVEVSAFVDQEQAEQEIAQWAAQLKGQDLTAFPLLVLVDNADFLAATLNNFLWVTFTRSNPAVDLHGVDAFIQHKHWGCRGALIIDARRKPHHAPDLVADPQVEARVDEYLKRLGR
jgi:4-hydroxy-3-polyprenylbenzoate decarboxylase